MARTKPTTKKAPAASKGGKKAAVEKASSTKKAAAKKDTTTPQGRLPRAAKSKAQETSYIESDHSEEEPEHDHEDDSGEDSCDEGSNFSREEVEVKVVKKEVPQKSDVPGFNVWKTGTKLASGKELTEMSQYDISISSFKQTVQILHNEMFTLKPLIFNEGPLKGRRVLIVEPTVITEYFPFLDLPPELRKMVYDILFVEPHAGKVAISTYKPVGQPRRAVRPGFRDSDTHKDLVWDKTFGKWIDQTPSEFSLLCVSKQLFQEAAPVAYGSNTFSFDDFKCATIFLKAIGNMREQLKYLNLSDSRFGTPRIIYTLFRGLKDAKDLRMLSLDHKLVCGDRGVGYSWSGGGYTMSVQNYVSVAGPMLRAVHQEGKAADDTNRVSDLIVLKAPSLCYSCTTGAPCRKVLGCQTPCKDIGPHHEELVAKLKKLIRKEIKGEAVSEDEEKGDKESQAKAAMDAYSP